MVFRLPVLVFSGVLFSISAASFARADTIPVTSGALTVAWDDPSSFELFGRAFLLLGTGLARVMCLRRRGAV